MKTRLLVLLILIGLILCYLTIIIFSPFLNVKAEPIEKKLKRKTIPKCRQNIKIPIEDTFISAWLYIPEGIAKPVPCVILSNGLGGTKDVILEDFALGFVDAGFAAIAYDYRFFGESGGEPRQLFNGIKQQEDLKAVIDYARNCEKIDGDKIILWSTSAAGRYGINAAAKDPKIAGVISQCPSLDHSKDDQLVFKREGICYFLKLLIHAQRDKGRSRFGLTPHLIPIVGKPGDLALLNAPGALQGYQNLMSESEFFINGVCARSLLMLQGPDVIKTAHNVKCLVLILMCEKDTAVSPDTYKRVADILGEKARVIKYPVGHFDIYKGEYFEKAINAQIDFIKRLF